MDERKIRFGFLAFILDKLGEKRLYYGLIVAQKVVYFLKEAFSVSLPYNFYFYHFGPYSDALDWDLQMMKSFGFITIGADPKGTGYSIEVNKESSLESIQLAQSYIKQNSRKIDKILDIFGSYEPGKLELASTTHFVWKNNKQQGQPKTQLKTIVIEKVKKLKPKFTEEEIGEQYDYLVAQKIIA
jgi:uncharacterized protein YwgA